MAKLSDGTISWAGGMDTSRSPHEISEVQYAKGCNVVIPDSLGGIKVRPGLHCVNLSFKTTEERDIYMNGVVRAEGYFESGGFIYLVILVDGYVIRMREVALEAFEAEIININDRNVYQDNDGWIITIPGGCIVNNGSDYPIYVTDTTQRRTDPSKQEIGIGCMGVYLQNRLFYVDQSRRRILASDFLNPLKFTLEDTNIFGFACPDEDEIITAIGKQKSILNYTEGGNLIWSSTRDIYSADVRGTRSDWANLGTRVGKVTQTIPGFSAASSYSFESFNSNIYFRTKQFGIVDIRQSEYQFTNLDTLSNQSTEASYFLDNDTDWMLSKCYSKACNNRLFTTIAPEINESGDIYWNGILSLHNPVNFGQGVVPRRFESYFTGVRPWCLSVVKSANEKDRMFIHSHDSDGITRMYVMDEESDYDLDQNGMVREIQGFIETRSYNLSNPLLLKKLDKRFYRLRSTDRNINIKFYSRAESEGEWVEFWDTTHLIGRTPNPFSPINHKPQTRPFVYMSAEKPSTCYSSGASFLNIQYRIEFTGPLNLDCVVVTGDLNTPDPTVYKQEKYTSTVSYDHRPDYYYNIH